MNVERKEIQKAIGKKLKYLRCINDMTQETVVQRLSEIIKYKMTKEAYQHYEAGRRLPPTNVLFGLNEVFRVNILKGIKEYSGSPLYKVVDNEDVIAFLKTFSDLPQDVKDWILKLKDVIMSIAKTKAYYDFQQLIEDLVLYKDDEKIKYLSEQIRKRVEEIKEEEKAKTNIANTDKT